MSSTSQNSRRSSQPACSLRQRQQLADLGQNLPRAERFGQIPVASRRPRLGFVAGQRVRGDGDDRNMTQIRIGLDPPRRLIAIDDRKLNVHENEIRPALGRHCDALLAVDRLDQLEAGIGEQILRMRRLFSVSSMTRISLLMPVASAPLTRIGTTMVKVEPTPTIDCTSMRPPCTLDQPPRDRQAKPGATFLPRDAVVNLLKLLEDARLVRGRNARTGVVHRDREMRRRRP